MKASQTIFILLLIVGLLTAAAETARPKQKGIVPGPAGQFITTGSQIILTYYDFDRDGKIDILTKSITPSQQLLNIYIWNHNRKEYYLSGSTSIDYTQLQTVMVSSFKVLDKFSLVMFFSGFDSPPSIVVRPFQCIDYLCSFHMPLAIPQLDSVDDTNPTLFGVNGQIGIVFHKSGPQLLLFQQDQSYKVNPLINYIQNGQGKITAFKSSYFGDYNGDCLPDVILLKQQSSGQSTLQFIGGSETNSFIYLYDVMFEQTIQHFTVQDINFDGKNDLILLLASGHIQIHYHKQGSNKQLCSGVALDLSPYDYTVSSQIVTLIQRYQFNAPLYSNTKLLFGDYDNDGYDDLTVTLLDSNGLPNAQLYRNIPCSGQECGTYNPKLIEESLTLNTRSFSQVALTGVGRVSTKLSFIDIFEDGTLDFMLNVQITDAKGSKTMIIQPVYNNIDYDAFFLTLTILAPINLQNLLQNTEFIGGCASFYVTLLSGQLAPKTANQLAQTGNSLQLPYVRTGLGRTNNYLQSVTLTVPRSVLNSQFIHFPNLCGAPSSPTRQSSSYLRP